MFVRISNARGVFILRVLLLLMALLVVGSDQVSAAPCPDPCKQLKESVAKLKAYVAEEKKFIDEFYKKYDAIYNKLLKAKAKLISLNKSRRAQGLAPVRGTRKAKFAFYRAEWTYRKLLEYRSGLNRALKDLNALERKLAQCTGTGRSRKDWRLAREVLAKLMRVYRSICVRQKRIKGYTAIYDQFVIKEESFAQYRNLKYFYIAFDRPGWRNIVGGKEAKAISEAFDELLRMWRNRYGEQRKRPWRCGLKRKDVIQELPRRGRNCFKQPPKEPDTSTDASPGSTKVKEVVVRDGAACVGSVVRRIVIVEETPGKPGRPEKPGVPFTPDRNRVPPEKRKKPPVEKPEPKEPPRIVTEQPRAPKEGPPPPEETPQEPEGDEDEPDLGLVKAEKKVVDLIVSKGDTGKPLSEGVIKVADVMLEQPPAHPEELPTDVVRAAMLEVYMKYRDKPWAKLLITWSELLNLIVTVGADMGHDARMSPADFDGIVDDLVDNGVEEERARKIVEDIKERARDLQQAIQRKEYAEPALGGMTDKQGRMRVVLPAGARVKRTEKVVYEPRRQKVVLLPGNAGKEAVRRLAKAGKVKELPVMKDPRTGKPVKPVVVNIPDTPEAGKKLRDAAREAGGGDAVIYDDPCLDKEGQTAFVPNDPLYAGKGAWGQDFPNQWAIRRIGLTSDKRSAWAVKPPPGKTRQVVVAVIDSGLDWKHPDFDVRNLWRNPGEIPGNGEDDDGNGYVDDIIGWDFVNDTNRPWDQDGHGTFVAGVIGAATNNGYGIAGINPDAKLMILKALGPFGRGHGSAVARAVLYAVDNGADIINLSLGTGTYTPLLHMAIERAREKGVIVVVAAGNQAKRTKGRFPAGLPGVITVTATDRRDRRAPFSNWGTHVDIAAPGVDVLSLRARGTDLLAFMPDVKYELGKGVVGPDRAFYRASGTSFAAPMVSGALSLILSRRPEVTREQAVRMLLNSARDIETPGIDNYTGYGLLDVAAALRADPQFYTEARITGVRVVRGKKGAVVQVLGTARANRLKEVRLYIGKGRSPSRWRAVGRPSRKNVRRGIVGRIPARLLAGAARWTLRLVVAHADGTRREARYVLRVR